MAFSRSSVMHCLNCTCTFLIDPLHLVYTVFIFHGCIIYNVGICTIYVVCMTKESFVLSEKALVERALELREELDNAASDVSSLFTKIG